MFSFKIMLISDASEIQDGRKDGRQMDPLRQFNPHNHPSC